MLFKPLFSFHLMKTKSAIIILDACRYDHINKSNSPNIFNLSNKSENYTNTYATTTESSTSMPKFFSGNDNEGSIGFKKETFLSKLSIRIGDIFPPRIRKKLLFLKPFIAKNKQDLKHSLLEKVNLNKCCISSCPYYIFGMEKGFTKAHRVYLDKNWQDPKAITSKALDFLNENKDNFFLLCHFLQPHAPYLAPFSKIKFTENDFKELKKKIKSGGKLTGQEIKNLKIAYKNNLKYVDKELAPLIKKLKKLGADIIITSDHGELLGEYNQVEHPRGFKKCEELCHVPLIWYKPNQEPKTISERIYFHEILRRLFPEVKINQSR